MEFMSSTLAARLLDVLFFILFLFLMSLIPDVPKFIILEHVFMDVSYDDLRRCYEDTESLCSSIDEIFK